MNAETLHAVTGAFGYSGRYITQRLLAAGICVRTLTNSPQRHNPFGQSVDVQPFNWHDPKKLTEALTGVDVLYNTYWVRFNSRTFCFAEAIENNRKLLVAAKAAGVRRIVHVSITNPDINSDLEYFRGKAQVEQALTDSGVDFTIRRPAVIFGREDILINNIAWVLRHLPVFGVFGDGQYKLQPIYVDDLAELA
ncbi:MAG: SDR family oxidoreductase, partial [Phycisphaerae bacterium]